MSKPMMQCLKKRRPGRKILAQLTSPCTGPWLTQPIAPFGVVVEAGGLHPFLAEHPYKLIAEGAVSDLPWLVSVTAHEGLYPGRFLRGQRGTSARTQNVVNWTKIAPHLLTITTPVQPRTWTSSVSTSDSSISRIRRYPWRPETR
ncbi:venom carboxylesterase-6-like [Homalodisca vitripennis]|uniref:venom carboxylesterase-6-like n=1 Tax=Homalodisca vitripennis TaxID=197043 RepID=UPI001EEBCB39|nr:venom carboxylesterase-6-like [Homalodisca vitripennis]